MSFENFSDEEFTMPRFDDQDFIETLELIDLDQLPIFQWSNGTWIDEGCLIASQESGPIYIEECQTCGEFFDAGTPCPNLAKHQKANEDFVRKVLAPEKPQDPRKVVGKKKRKNEFDLLREDNLNLELNKKTRISQTVA